MRHIKALICVLLAVIPALIHAQLSEEEPAKKSSRKLTFGIRGDKDLDLYNKVATNAPPFNGADYPDFSSTLSLIYSHDGSTFRDSHATGVLIDPYWVLTVGHNFYDLNSDSTSAPPEGITVQTGSDAQQPKKVYTVDKVVLHPTWQEGQQDDMTSNDICLLKLKEPITEIVHTTIMTKKTELLNATVWLAGFGDYNRKGSDYRTMSPKMHAIENRLDRKVSITLTTQTGTDFDTGLLVTDFDPPSGDLNSLSGDNLYDDYLNILGE
ncbi:MAG: trypsin-like serine protease, partial [Croceivirga sp.]